MAQARILGGAIGLAVATAIFNARPGGELEGVLTGEQLAGLRRSLGMLGVLDGVQREAVRGVFAWSFDRQLRVCAYVAAVCLVVSGFAYTKDPPEIRRRGQAI